MSPEAGDPGIPGRGDAGEPVRGGWQRWMGVGLVLLGIALVAGFASYTVSLLALLEEQNMLLRRLEEEVTLRGEVLRLMTSARPELLRLTGPSGAGGWRGTLLWDRETRRAFLRITGVAPADSAGKFHLWILDKGEPVSVTGFRVPPQGDVSLVIERLPVPETGEGGVVVVTTDPDGSARFGSGTLVLTGSLSGSNNSKGK